MDIDPDDPWLGYIIVAIVFLLFVLGIVLL